jgi:hypothetical protein
VEERRKFKRFPVQLRARYLRENEEEWKEEPMKVTGILRWIMEEEEEMNFSGSIEFTNILDEIELANLTYFMS